MLKEEEHPFTSPLPSPVLPLNDAPDYFPSSAVLRSILVMLPWPMAGIAACSSSPDVPPRYANGVWQVVGNDMATELVGLAVERAPLHGVTCFGCGQPLLQSCEFDTKFVIGGLFGGLGSMREAPLAIGEGSQFGYAATDFR